MKGAIDTQDLMTMMRGHQMAAIVRAGVELGVFEELARGPEAAHKLAARRTADPRGMRILLDGLAALGLVEKEGDLHYRLSEVSRRHLVEGGPAYLGDMVRLFTSDTMWDGLRTLPEAVRMGGTVLDEHAETPGHSFWEDFARWTSAMAAPGGQRLQELLQPWVEEQDLVKVLDVACGTGLYAFSIAQRHRNVRVTSLDWPNVLSITKRYASHLQIEDQVSYIEGDMFTSPLEGPYDLIVASHVFHHFSEERSRTLLSRLAGELRPGGKIAIHDFSPGSGGSRDDAFAHIFSTTMLVWTRQGEAYPEDFYVRLLAQCGFDAPAIESASTTPSKFFLATKRP